MLLNLDEIAGPAAPSMLPEPPEPSSPAGLDCFAEMVGLPERCQFRDASCGSEPCRDWQQVDK